MICCAILSFFPSDSSHHTVLPFVSFRFRFRFRFVFVFVSFRFVFVSLHRFEDPDVVKIQAPTKQRTTMHHPTALPSSSGVADDSSDDGAGGAAADKVPEEEQEEVLSPDMQLYATRSFEHSFAWATREDTLLGGASPRPPSPIREGLHAPISVSSRKLI